MVDDFVVAFQNVFYAINLLFYDITFNFSKMERKQEKKLTTSVIVG